MFELQAENPPGQPPARLPLGQLGALVGDVRVDVAVEDDGIAGGEPLPDLGCRLGAVARKEERHQIGVHRLHAAEFAAQEAGDEFAVDRRIEAREVHVTALHAALGKELAQQGYLGRFPGAVQTFEYD